MGVGVIVPKYYYIPRAEINSSRSGLGRKMATNEGVDDEYFLWGQSVYFVMKLLGMLRGQCIYVEELIECTYESAGAGLHHNN